MTKWLYKILEKWELKLKKQIEDLEKENIRNFSKAFKKANALYKFPYITVEIDGEVRHFKYDPKHKSITFLTENFHNKYFVDFYLNKEFIRRKYLENYSSCNFDIELVDVKTGDLVFIFTEKEELKKGRVVSLENYRRKKYGT